MMMSLTILCIFFFFKQKTAYEMRISDWSSDVCSSDLIGADRPLPGFLDERLDRWRGRLAMIERGCGHRRQVGDRRQLVARRVGARREIEHGRNEDEDRKSVV